MVIAGCFFLLFFLIQRRLFLGYPGVFTRLRVERPCRRPQASTRSATNPQRVPCGVGAQRRMRIETAGLSGMARARRSGRDGLPGGCRVLRWMLRGSHVFTHPVQLISQAPLLSMNALQARVVHGSARGGRSTGLNQNNQEGLRDQN